MNTTTEWHPALALLITSVISTGAHADNSSSTVQILDATIRDQKIAGATVILQKNGEQSAATTTNPQGQAIMQEAMARSCKAKTATISRRRQTDPTTRLILARLQ